jgi:hypothetical protein
MLGASRLLLGFCNEKKMGVSLVFLEMAVAF